MFTQQLIRLSFLLVMPTMFACSTTAGKQPLDPNRHPDQLDPRDQHFASQFGRAAASTGIGIEPMHKFPEQTATEQEGDAAEQPATTTKTFNFDRGQPIRLDFQVTGAEGREVVVGLARLPVGAELRNRHSTTPTLAWDNPSTGMHPVQFLLRDMKLCRQARHGSLDCDMHEAHFGRLEPQGPFDVLSEIYQISVLTDGKLPTAVLGPNGRPMSRGSMIDHILAMGGSRQPGIMGILGSLTSGQLGGIITGMRGGSPLSSLLSGLTGGAFYTSHEPAEDDDN